MAHIEGKASVDALLEAVQGGPEPTVRAAAARGIGYRNLKGAVDVLLPALGDVFSDVRAAATAALYAVGWEPSDAVGVWRKRRSRRAI